MSTTENTTAALLKATNGRRWTKGTADRLYIEPADALRFINQAGDQDDRTVLGKSARRDLAGAKFWIDLATGTAHAENLRGNTAVKNLAGRFTEAVAATVA